MSEFEKWWKEEGSAWSDHYTLARQAWDAAIRSAVKVVEKRSPLEVYPGTSKAVDALKIK